MKKFILCLPFLLFLMGCQEKDVLKEVKLPPTPVLSIKKTYGVVEFAYLKVRSEPKKEGAADITQLRSGTIVEVLTSTPQEEEVEGKVNRWYQIQYGGSRGWVFGAYLKIFDSLDRARNAARAGALPSKP